MKKLFVVLALFLGLGFAVPSHAQQFTQSITLTVANTSTIALGAMYQGGNVVQHVVTWIATSGTGSVSTCTVQLQTSSTGASFSNVGTAQTCTSSGSYAYTGAGANYVQLNITSPAMTGTATVQINYYGYTNQIGTGDNFYVVPLGACAWGSSGGTVTPSTSQGLLAVGASLTNVLQIATTTGTETATLSCDIAPPSRLTTGKGITITSAIVEYGNSTGNLASMNLPTLSTITMPAPSTSETPSTVTPVGVGGTITTTPAVASANLTAVTAGAFYSEAVSVGTPLVYNSSLTTPTKLILSQGFVGPSSASLTLYAGGVVVYYITNPL